MVIDKCPKCGETLDYDPRQGIHCPNRFCGIFAREPDKCKLCGTVLQVAAGTGQFCPNRECDNDTDFGYTPEQQRVAEYILETTKNAVGAGFDPIGFLMASHEYSRVELRNVLKENAQLKFVMDFPGCNTCPIKQVRDVKD